MEAPAKAPPIGNTAAAKLSGAFRRLRNIRAWGIWRSDDVEIRGRTTLEVNYDRISASLGSLLLVWSQLEKSFRDEVIRFHGSLPPRAHGIAAVVRTWESAVIAAQPASSLCPSLATIVRCQLQGPLDMRNGLCHGLVGISAANKQVPAQLHWELNGEKHSISWEDLQKCFGWLSRLPRAISIISDRSLDRLGSRATNTAENREWWRSEFDLELPEP